MVLYIWVPLMAFFRKGAVRFWGPKTGPYFMELPSKPGHQCPELSQALIAQLLHKSQVPIADSPPRAMTIARVCSQRAQYPLIKEYSVNHNMKPYII